VQLSGVSDMVTEWTAGRWFPYV